METTNNVIQFTPKTSFGDEDELHVITEDLDIAFDSFLIHMAELGYEDVLEISETSVRLGYILELLRLTFVVGRGYGHEWENHLNLILGILRDAGAITEEEDE